MNGHNVLSKSSRKGPDLSFPEGREKGRFYVLRADLYSLS